MRARKLLLLVAILTCGALIEAAHGVRDELGIGPTGCRVLSGRFYGPSFAFDSEGSRDLAAGSGVLVENAFGAVTVRGTGSGAVRAKLKTRVYAPDREKARAFAERVELVLDDLDGRLRVTTNRDDLAAAGERTPGFETELEIEVPPGTDVEVRSHHARVALSDLGAAKVSASYEPVQIARVSGALRVDARQGKVSVESVGGELDLDTSHGEVSVADVAGSARLEVRHGAVRARGVADLKLTQRYGDVEVSEIAGDLEVEAVHAGVRARDVTGGARVETSYGDVRLGTVGGDVRAVTRHGGLRVESAGGALTAEVSDGRVDLDAVTGPLEVSARHSDVRVAGLREGGRIESDTGDAELRDYTGALEVHVRLGDVRLFPGGPVESPLVAESREGGSVFLELEAGDGFRLDAAAPHGNVSVDLPGFETSVREKGRLQGSVGDGQVTLSLRAGRGDVVVRASR